MAHVCALKVLFAQELGLVGKGYADFSGTGLQHALATQSGIDPGVHGPVYKVFFSVVQFFDVLGSCFNIQMASTASTNGPTIVVKLYVVVQTNFQ
jgi:hypothetical protein